MGLGGEMGDGWKDGGRMTSTHGTSPFGDTEMSMEEGMSEEYDEGMMMGYGPDGEGMMLVRTIASSDLLIQASNLVGFIDTEYSSRMESKLGTLEKFLESPEAADEQFVQSATSDPSQSLDDTCSRNGRQSATCTTLITG